SRSSRALGPMTTNVLFACTNTISMREVNCCRSFTYTSYAAHACSTCPIGQLSAQTGLTVSVRTRSDGSDTDDLPPVFLGQHLFGANLDRLFADVLCSLEHDAPLRRPADATERCRGLAVCGRRSLRPPVDEHCNARPAALFVGQLAVQQRA